VDPVENSVLCYWRDETDDVMLFSISKRSCSGTNSAWALPEISISSAESIRLSTNSAALFVKSVGLTTIGPLFSAIFRRRYLLGHEGENLQYLLFTKLETEFWIGIFNIRMHMYGTQSDCPKRMKTLGAMSAGTQPLDAEGGISCTVLDIILCYVCSLIKHCLQ
jgi:hypothetical protein